MFKNTYYLSNVICRLCFKDNYQIELSGCLNANIVSGAIPDVACLGYHDTYGAGKPDMFLNLKGDALVSHFVNSRRRRLGLESSSEFLNMVDLSFGVGQGGNSVAVFANYKWYSDRKTVDYEYKLGDGTVICKGRASIKDMGVASYIKHFMRTMASVDISPYA